MDTVHLPVATQLFVSELFGCETKGHHQLKEESLEHWTLHFTRLVDFCDI